MTKWTPGPWRVEVSKITDGREAYQMIYIEAQPGARAGMELPRLTTVVDPELGVATKEDAALIAAAPELYEALEQVRRHLTAPLTDEGNAVWQQINAALAKARGEQ